MLRKIIAVLALVTVANMSQSHDPPIIPDCRTHSAITARNVHHISLCPADPGMATEIRWHNTEPIIVKLDHGNEEVTSKRSLIVWEFDEVSTKARILARHESYSQLELLSDAIIVGTTDGTLLFWDLWQNEILREISVDDGEISELLLHPSNEWLLIAIDNAHLFQFDLASQSLVEIQLQGVEEASLEALAFSKDGHLLAGAGQGTLRIWDTGSWDEWKSQRLSAELIKEVLFTNDNSHLIVLADASVSRWSLANQHLTFERELEAHPDKRPCEFNYGDISPDGSLLMTADSCSQIRAWDLTRDAEIYIPHLTFSKDNFSGLAFLFNPDGRYLAYVDEEIWTVLIVHEHE